MWQKKGVSDGYPGAVQPWLDSGCGWRHCLHCGGAYAFYYWEQCLVCAVSHLLKYRCAEVEQTVYCIVSLLQSVVCSVWTSAPESTFLKGSWGASSFPASLSQQVSGWKHAALLPSCSFFWFLPAGCRAQWMGFSVNTSVCCSLCCC